MAECLSTLYVRTSGDALCRRVQSWAAFARTARLQGVCEVSQHLWQKAALNRALHLLAFLHAGDDSGLSQDRQMPRHHRQISAAALRNLTYCAWAALLGEAHQQGHAGGIAQRLEKTRRKQLLQPSAAFVRSALSAFSLLVHLRHSASMRENADASRQIYSVRASDGKLARRPAKRCALDTRFVGTNQMSPCPTTGSGAELLLGRRWAASNSHAFER